MIITLCDYDPEWADLFEAEAARIRDILGESALMVEHVGSTAVRGLIAKPRIDIVLAVEDSADESAYVPLMERGGYFLQIREPDWYEHRMFKGPDTDVNVHVFSKECEEIGRMLRFRDHLRSNPIARERYAVAKRGLAKNSWATVQEYADAKTPIISQILSSMGRTDERIDAR